MGAIAINTNQTPLMRGMMPCQSCKGSGVVPLPEHLQVTLDLVWELGPVRTCDVFAVYRERYPAMEIGITAVNNRLAVLAELGIIARVGKRGKELIWNTPEVKK